MTDFARLPADRPLRVVGVGAGGMGMSWLRAVQHHPELKLVAIVDQDVRRAQGAAIRLRSPGLPVAESLAGVLGTQPDICLNATPPAAHFEVSAAALSAGLSVLSEKPFAATLKEAVELDALARKERRLLMIAQTRSREPGLWRLRDLVAELGPLSLVTTEFRRAYRAAGFRLAMDHPLLVDMAVHAFDAARFVIGQRPVAVYATEFAPAGSWFAGPAAATVTVEFAGGVHYVYTGSWCGDGLETAWSGRWRATGVAGTAGWDGAGTPLVEFGPGRDEPDLTAPDTGVVDDPVEHVMPVLDDFVAGVRAGDAPWGSSGGNLLTFAMVAAAIRSAQSQSRIVVDELLAECGATS